MRKVLFGENYQHEGFFHKWIKSKKYRGNTSVNCVTGIIQLSDGTIRLIEYQYIKFID